MRLFFHFCIIHDFAPFVGLSSWLPQPHPRYIYVSALSKKTLAKKAIIL